MKPDFSATNMRIFEIVGRLITALASLLGHPDDSRLYYKVDDEFIEYVKERGVEDKVVRKLLGFDDCSVEALVRDLNHINGVTLSPKEAEERQNKLIRRFLGERI